MKKTNAALGVLLLSLSLTGCLDTDGEIQGTIGGASNTGQASGVVVSTDPATDFASPDLG